MYYIGIIIRSFSLVELRAVSCDDSVVDLGIALWAIAEVCCCSEYMIYILDR